MTSTTSLIKEHVSKKSISLQRRVDNQDPSAKAELAQLRQSLNLHIGENPIAYGFVFDNTDPRLVGKSDKPTDAEKAMFYSLCLFALHMQGNSKAHMQGVSIAAAAAQIAAHDNKPFSEHPIRRKFSTLASASTVEDAVLISRGLIQQAKSKGISIDYGKFAADIFCLASNSYRNRVLLQWSRDISRNIAEEHDFDN